jgi:hypothetical protein
MLAESEAKRGARWFEDVPLVVGFGEPRLELLGCAHRQGLAHLSCSGEGFAVRVNLATKLRRSAENFGLLREFCDGDGR